MEITKRGFQDAMEFVDEIDRTATEGVLNRAGRAIVV